MKINFNSALLIFTVTIILAGFGTSNVLAEQFTDKGALTGDVSGRALFDINVSAPQKAALYLTVIKQTREDLLKQNVQPDFVVAFRGPSVRLISEDILTFEEEDQENLKVVAALIRELSKDGVKFEACSIATSLFKVDNDRILSEVKIVGNTFVSLIGYQSKDYSLITIQ